ncbi:helix-turn-helix transcriptional regulator [Paenibacillus sp. IB182496]|uniref:Helix-turn-helix transcriptional regulator n=1 Tax=Paenibacillus sabuli TaxID=2772509 RepID=A0A927GRX4_9BACL|nr:helix-turn-helix transcriptional regulator [Paenibacillus sabuli]MBD2845716.1 helix-turn-helix transcriptional regulator [Paenibacillus sabuli]
MSFDYALIGKRIRKARESKGLTQEKLAEHLDVSNAYISKIERGRTPINLERLAELCVILDKNTEYILSGTNSRSDDFLRNEIIDMLEGCSPEKIKLIASIVRQIVDFKA